jgi:hypothetical protein
MRRILLAVILAICGSLAFGQEAFPKTPPTKMKLCARDWCIDFHPSWRGRTFEGVVPETCEQWTLHLDVWSEQQVGVTGFSGQKDADEKHRLCVFAGVPQEDDSAVAEGILFDGYDRDEQEFTLSWDKADINPFRIYW